MIFEKVSAVCPHCRKTNVFEVGCVSGGCSMKKFTCSFCSKDWQEDLHHTTKLAKSAPSSYGAELNQLRAQLAVQFDELTQKINAILKRREIAAHTFRPNGVEKDGVVEQELQKALVNGKPAGAALDETDSASPRFQPAVSTGTFERQRGGGELHAEKTDAADAELKRAFANPVPVGGRFTPRG